MAVLETASGGATGPAGAAVSASAAPLMNQLQDGIASSLQTAGLNADVAKGISSGIAGLTAAGEGQFWVEFNAKMLKCRWLSRAR